MIRFAAFSLFLLMLVAGLLFTSEPRAKAQGLGNDPNVVMLDNCSPTDPEYIAFGGCPEGGGALKGFKGDVPLAEFFALLTSPLAPGGQIIGHPSWRNEPSYLNVPAGQTIRVVNRGGRVHSFTEVTNFGGGFVPLLNGAMQSAPECGANFVPNPGVKFVGVGETQALTGVESGLRRFQCCIHPWMRAAIRVQ
jgi:hypothetical protein